MTDGLTTSHPATTADFAARRDQLLALARHRLRVFAPLFDRPLLHHPDVADHLTRAIRHNRHFQVQVLYADAQDALERRHELLELARRLPSYFALRQLPTEHRNRRDCVLIGDSRCLLSRPDERYLLDGLFHAEPGRINRACDAFDELWAVSSPDSNTRRLLL